MGDDSNDKGMGKKQLNVTNCLFLGLTILASVTAVPAYIWHFGLDAFQVGLFLSFFIITGLSITLGYHRLFSHCAFRAHWSVRLFTLLFGAAAFENSALRWACDHRRHHKFVDDEGDPYNAKEGLLHSHIGWILWKDPEQAALKFVDDLQRDPLVVWQDRYYRSIAILMGFGVPAVLGGLWGGWIGALGGLLIGGLARVVMVQQFTFLINSLCHFVGNQPYSSRCTARDSALMAVFTFGEGYHNFHHAFQHDYRNGVKPWHFDPTKWSIWILNKLGLVEGLRRVPEERIIQRRAAEKCRQLASQIESTPGACSELILAQLHELQQRIELAYRRWEELESEYRKAMDRKVEASWEKIAELRSEFWEARKRFRETIQEWQEAHRVWEAQLAWARA